MTTKHIKSEINHDKGTALISHYDHDGNLYFEERGKIAYRGNFAVVQNETGQLRSTNGTLKSAESSQRTWTKRAAGTATYSVVPVTEG